MWLGPTDELLKMALGHELKGLLLNYALATRQKSEVASAKEKAVVVDKNLACIEQDLLATKEKLKGEVAALKTGYEEKVSKLVKIHKETLAKAREDHAGVVRTMQIIQESLSVRDERIATLSKENKAALTELATLRQEKEKWASEKEGLEDTIGAQYDDGFNYALYQVKVLFPDIDQARLGVADAMLKIDGDKLVPYAPVEE
jgi:hypothetical protein